MSVTFVHSLFDKNTTASASDYISAVLIRMLPCAVNSLFLAVTFSHYVLNISRKVTTPHPKILTKGQCCWFTLARTLLSAVLYVGKILLVGFRIKQSSLLGFRDQDFT